VGHGSAADHRRVYPLGASAGRAYLLQHGGKADPHALHVIERGGNDILDTTTGTPEALTFQIATGIVQSERMLRQACARHFVIPDLFNVALLPAAAGNTAFAATASSVTNRFLNQMLEAEEEPARGSDTAHERVQPDECGGHRSDVLWIL
jgi:phospholipase/lecithinase/hemolysin